LYNQLSTVVVLNLMKLPVHEPPTLQDITNDHIQGLRICFDNVNLLETSYDYSMAEIPASKLTYTYTDPLQIFITYTQIHLAGYFPDQYTLPSGRLELS